MRDLAQYTLGGSCGPDGAGLGYPLHSMLEVSRVFLEKGARRTANAVTLIQVVRRN